MPIRAIELARADRTLRRATQGLAACGVGLLLLQAFAIVLDAAARWLLGTALHGIEDINGLLLSVSLGSFMPALFMARGNVTVTLLGQALGRGFGAWLDVFGQAVTLLLLAVLAWQYAGYAASLGDQHSVIVQLPKAPAAWVAAAFLTLTALLQALVVLFTIASARQPEAFEAAEER